MMDQKIISEQYNCPAHFEMESQNGLVAALCCLWRDVSLDVK